MSSQPMSSEAGHRIQPLWRRPRVARLLVVALLAEIGFAVLNISTMPVYLREDRGFGEGIIALVVTTFLLSEALFKGSMGHLADRHGRRRLMVLGTALTAFTPLLTMAVPGHWGVGETLSLMALRVVDGLGAAMLWPAAFALMNDTVADGERQEAMSLLNMCYLVGIALALPIGGLVNDTLGPWFAEWGGARVPSLLLASLLFAGVSVSAFRFVPSGRELRRSRSELHGPADGEDLRTLLLSARRIPSYLLLGFVTFVGVGFPMVPIKLFAKDQFQMSETQFGVLVLPGAILMAALSVPMAKYGERIGRVRAVHLGMFLCTVGLAVISSGAFVPALRTAWVFGLGGIPLGIGFLLTIPAWYASVSELDPKTRAANIGAVMTAQGLGAIVGAPLGGLVYQHRYWFADLYRSVLAAGGVDRWVHPEALRLLTEGFGRYTLFLGCLAFVLTGWLLGLRILRPTHGPDSHGSAPARGDNAG
ncbi:MAG: MFS transporter [Fimbriimonadales bacterium]|nr:MFS transporter [Fimbriimonadales bacterium]